MPRAQHITAQHDGSSFMTAQHDDGQQTSIRRQPSLKTEFVASSAEPFQLQLLQIVPHPRYNCCHLGLGSTVQRWLSSSPLLPPQQVPPTFVFLGHAIVALVSVPAAYAVYDTVAALASFAALGSLAALAALDGLASLAALASFAATRLLAAAPLLVAAMLFPLVLLHLLLILSDASLLVIALTSFHAAAPLVAAASFLTLTASFLTPTLRSFRCCTDLSAAALLRTIPLLAPASFSFDCDIGRRFGIPEMISQMPPPCPRSAVRAAPPPAPPSREFAQ